MSQEHLCALPSIERLIQAGIRSFKIEGRNRPAEYVGTVTGAYRRAIDFYFDHCGSDGFEAQFKDLKERGVNEVAQVYHSGVSTGFYHGKPLDQWTSSNGNEATRTKEFVGPVRNYYSMLQVAKIQIQSHSFSITSFVRSSASADVAMPVLDCASIPRQAMIFILSTTKASIPIDRSKIRAFRSRTGGPFCSSTPVPF